MSTLPLGSHIPSPLQWGDDSLTNSGSWEKDSCHLGIFHPCLAESTTAPTECPLPYLTYSNTLRPCTTILPTPADWTGRSCETTKACGSHSRTADIALPSPTRVHRTSIDCSGISRLYRCEPLGVRGGFFRLSFVSTLTARVFGRRTGGGRLPITYFVGSASKLRAHPSLQK